MQKRSVHTLLLALAGLTIMLVFSAPSFAQIGVAITFGPPAIPVYDQPICPGDGYLWTPGYWAWDYDYDDYYWVPGTWILAPEVGFLWTPGWWGWRDGGFFWTEGYWGPVVGFYGGINYGFGYFGVGFQGGRWDGGHFFYNRAVMNVNVTEIHNVYNSNVVINNNTRVAYNGGNGGIDRRPTPEEEAAARERHVGPVAAQTQHVQAARSNPELRASANQGRPAIAATSRPGDFKGSVVAAREAGGRYTPPPNRGTQARGNEARPENNARPAAGAPGAENNAGRTYTHVSELPPAERPAAPNTGDAKQDQKYQKQQQKLYDQQQKERQKVAQQQEKEDQKLAKQNASAAQRQQQEQRHAQQTQQLQQRHAQQTQQMRQRMQPARPAGRPPR